jgi:hypothetical protein
MEEFGAPPTSNWTMQLDCGHQIAIPLGATVPALPACVVQHQLSCRGFETAGSPELVSDFFMPMTRGVGFR